MSGSDFIGFNKVSVAGYGLYDVRFIDRWDETFYDSSFVAAAGPSLLATITTGGVADQTYIDKHPESAFGCGSTTLCGWTTAFNSNIAGSIIDVGIVYNYNFDNDVSDFYVNSQVQSYYAVNDTQVALTFLSWKPSKVSSVPLPAAAFMFAPALLGFMGLRRRASCKNV